MTFFSQFLAQTKSHLTELLEQDDFTLEEILDEEDLLQECFAENGALLSYLTRPDVMEKLINLVTIAPPETLELESRFKYPAKACKVLSCDVDAITEAVAQEESLAGLFSWLEKPEQSNPLLASFFQQIATVLVQKKPDALVTFLESKNGILDQLLAHTGVVEFLKVFVLQGEMVPESGICQWLCAQGMIPSVLRNVVGNNVEIERRSNSGQLFVEIVSLAGQTLSEEGCTPLLSAILSQKSLGSLFSVIKAGPVECAAAFCEAVTCLCAVLDLYMDSEIRSESVSQALSESLADGGSMNQLLAGVSACVPDLISTLKEPKICATPLQNQVERLEQPLGVPRLRIMELLVKIFSGPDVAPFVAAQESVVDGGIMTTSLGLLIKYPWNNIMHHHVTCVMMAVLRDPHKSVAAKAVDGTPALILEAVAANTEATKRTGIRLGHMGHVIMLAKQVDDALTAAPQLAANMPEDVATRWATFTRGELVETLRLYLTPMGEPEAAAGPGPAALEAAASVSLAALPTLPPGIPMEGPGGEQAPSTPPASSDPWSSGGGAAWGDVPGWDSNAAANATSVTGQSTENTFPSADWPSSNEQPTNGAGFADFDAAFGSS